MDQGNRVHKSAKIESSSSSSSSSASTTSVAMGPQPSSSAVTPLSEEEKQRLFAKYGQIKAPTAGEMTEVAQAGCKMQ